jgi:uncharacterized repeat protein (TIGR01451 family)
MASDNLARQISSSWTWPGGPNATTDNLFMQLAAQGQSFFQASGDDDAYTSAIPQPADSAYITVVGGTTLSTSGPGGAWTSETTWNWYNSGLGTNGSSGGSSTTVAIPTWQQSVSMAANQGSTTMRNIPDVALTADNIWITYNNGSSGAVGGTSCAAPLWAGFAALINQQALSNGKQPIGFFNPSLYSIAAGVGYASAFHDITTGNNTNKTSPTKFQAVSGFDLCTGLGTPAGSALINALAGPAVPQISTNSYAIVTESCANNAVDPGETVTVNFGLINVGSASTTNLVATLQSSTGVSAPSGPQSYGVLTAGGSVVSRPFTFTAVGSCGGVITPTFQLQDGASNLGTLSFAIRLGALSTITTFSENFDGVSAPALPTQWTSVVTSGLQANWSSTNGFADTTPNSVFVPDAVTATQTELTSPVFSISSISAQLTFRHNYNLASRIITHPRSTNYYDGGVLQISIGGGPFTDILTAGASFVAGGYNCTLSTGTANPLAGAQAWGASSGGWLTTTVNLPASTAGQNVQLKWICGTGVNSFVAVGWFIDSVSVQDTSVSCCSSNADVLVTQAAAPNPAAVARNLVYTLTVSNAGPSPASGVVVTDSLPSAVTFLSGSPGCSNFNGSVTCAIGTMSANSSSNVVITVQPTAAGPLTNIASVSAITSDSNLANNSSVSTLTAYVPPTVSTQPTNQVTNVGGSAAFSVAANGSSPLTYQWTFGGASVAGATAATLTLANVQTSQAGNYAAVISNMAGSVTSAVATLTVLVPPSVVAQPTNQTIVAGANATFRVSASGTAPLSYQWMANGATVAGATATSFVLNNVQTNQSGGYCVVITNSAGSITSLLANLTVLVPPSFTLMPTNQTVVLGSNVTFQAGASGSAPLSSQWFFGGSALPGTTSTTLALGNVQTNQDGNYTVVVTNSAGAATSSVARLTVLVPPFIIAQPTNQTVIAGGNVSFQVAAAGSAPLGYQWWINGTNAVGGNANSLALTNVQASQAGGYSVVVTNVAGSVTSSVANLTIGMPPAITQQPASQTVIQGGNAMLSVVASGDAPLTYQWRFKSIAISGGTGSSYTVASASAADAGAYDVLVSNAYGTVSSAAAQLTILVPPSINNQPANSTVIVGASASFQVSASGTAPLGYQWWFNGTNAVGGNTNSITLTNVQVSQAGGYTVVVTNSAGMATSLVAVLTVGTPPGIAQQPASLTVVKGQDANFNVSSTGDAPFSYQWRFNGNVINGANNSSYTVAAATETNAGRYDVVVNNPFGSITSSVAQLTVLVSPSVAAQPTNQTVLAGGTAIFQVSASGTSPLTYQWWFHGTNSVGANTNILTLINAQVSQMGAYIVVITNVVGSVTSSVANLTIGMPPAITQQPSNATVVQGQSTTFSLVSSGEAPLSYQWRYNGATITGATTPKYLLAGVTAAEAGAYDVVVSNAYGTVTSAVAQLTVLIPPSISGQPTNQTVLVGGNANFFVTASGMAPLTYQWSLNGTSIPGATAATLSLTQIQANQAGTYAVLVTNSVGSVNSTGAYLKILVPPVITGPLIPGTNVSVQVSSESGLSYLLEYKNNLQDPSWNPASAWTPGTGGMIRVSDTNALTSSRFYRVRCQ